MSSVPSALLYVCLAGMHGFEGDAENHCTVCMYDPERKAPQIDIDISSFMPSSSADFGNDGTGGGSVRLCSVTQHATQHNKIVACADRVPSVCGV